MSFYEKLQSIGIQLNKTTGTTKTKCPKCSNSRKHKSDPCLSVNIDEGLYNCHNCDFRGTVAFEKIKPKEYFRPTPTNNTNLSDRMVSWFKTRGISPKTLQGMKISEGLEYMPQKGYKVNTAQFNYYRKNELINIKYRTGDKHFKMIKDAELIFYNLDCMVNSNSVVIVEGEIDCLTFIECDITNVISVPNGASKGSQKLEYLDNCWGYFEKINKVYIGTDNDEAGISLRNELIRRLGDERCFIIDYADCKDANEYALKHGKTSLSHLLSNAKPVPIEGVFTVDMLYGELVDFYQNGLPKGEGIGLSELDNHIRFIPGQLTVITGIPNQGKSEFLDMICERLAVFSGWRFGIFSPENFPISIHLSKLVEKVLGKSFSGHSKISQEELSAAVKLLNEHFFFIRPFDENFGLDNILEKSKKLVLKYGINALIIDPWNTIEHQHGSESETNYISAQLAKITSFMQRYKVHIFLVAHPTKVGKDKLTGKYEVPTLYNISGSANFFNKAFNGFTVYRDYEKNTTTVYIQKIKFKHQGKVGAVEFVYDIISGRYNEINSAPDTRSHLEVKTSSLRPNVDFTIPLKDQNEYDEIPF